MTGRPIEHSLILLAIYVFSILFIFIAILGSSFGILYLFDYLFAQFPSFASAFNAAEFKINIYNVSLVSILLSLCVFIIIKLYESYDYELKYLSNTLHNVSVQLETIGTDTQGNNSILKEINDHNDKSYYQLQDIKSELETISDNTFNSESYLPEVFDTEVKCPYCNKSLRTENSKQCPHCLKSWHNEDV